MEPINWAPVSVDQNYSLASNSVGALVNDSLNNTRNGNAGFQSESTVVMAVISLSVFVIGLTGNTLSIYVVLRYAKMKTVTNMYIFNLAVADELYILGLPLLTTQNVLSYWPFGSFLCRVAMTADSLNQFTSIFCLTVMSIDRYLAVVHPIRSANWRRPKVAKVVNGTMWVLSFLVVLPVVIYSGVQEDLNTCNISWPEPRNLWSNAFILYTAILGFFGPLLVICMCYLLIVVKVKSVGARAGLTNRRRSERKVTRMVVIMVVVFVLCWLPFYIINVVNLVVILPETNVMAGVYFFFVILTYVNSCANPLLYGFLSDNFRQSFRKALCIPVAHGVESGDSRRHRMEIGHMHSPLVLSSNNNVNGRVQITQGVQIEMCSNLKLEALASEPQTTEKITM